jgi:hypothetical protein
MSQSEHLLPFTVDYRIQTNGLPGATIKDLNSLKLFSKQPRNSTGILSSMEINIKQLATDIKDDVILMDIIQKCSSVGKIIKFPSNLYICLLGKGDRMLSFEFDIEFAE